MCLTFGAMPTASTYRLIADAGAEIFRWEGIGPLDKWVDDHIFLRVPKTHIVDYNELCAQWHLEISTSVLFYFVWTHCKWIGHVCIT